MNSADAVTLTAPADTDAYGRWLSGKIAGHATAIARGETISTLTADQLRNAAAELLAALDAAQRQGGIQ